MGSVIDKKRDRFSCKRSNKSIKTKGERLGWESLKNEKKVPLRDIVGEGRVVVLRSQISRKAIL